MVIKFNTKVQGIDNTSYIGGFWGVVRDVNSQANSCSVLVSMTQQVFNDIPVCSNEWVLNKGEYVAAERNLPPIGATVYVCTPDGTIDSAFILCSGFFAGETSEHTLYAHNQDDIESKNNEHEKVTQGGWNEIENYITGNRKFVSQDKNIEIQINPKKDNQKSQEKEISIKCWGNEFHFNEEGIKLTDINGNIIEMKSGSVLINNNLEILK